MMTPTLGLAAVATDSASGELAILLSPTNATIPSSTFKTTGIAVSGPPPPASGEYGLRSWL